MEKIALFIDYENFRGPADGVARLLVDLEKMGEVLVKRAYADWVRFSNARKPLSTLQIELIELPNVVTGKNGADIRLVIDAIEFAWMKPFLTTFVLISSDSDFLPLITRLREHNKRTVLIAHPTQSCEIMRNQCDLFIPSTNYHRGPAMVATAKNVDDTGSPFASSQKQNQNEKPSSSKESDRLIRKRGTYSLEPTDWIENELDEEGRTEFSFHGEYVHYD